MQKVYSECVTVVGQDPEQRPEDVVTLALSFIALHSGLSQEVERFDWSA